MRRLPLFCITIAAILLPGGTFAAEAVTAGQFGHSSHGQAFDEGPRQKAVLLQGMGNVTFPVTTKVADAQQFFNQGVAQLHGFWYFEAERSFRQVAMLDPQCAMAYWGMAMANIHGAKRGTEFIKKAVALKDTATPREQIWINSLFDYYQGAAKPDKERRGDMVKALERIIYEHPEDIEARAFLLFWIWDNRDRGWPIGSHAALDSLAHGILSKNPLHPGVHHYRIHFWNDVNDRRALDSAASGGQSAPGIAHLWHMPGHTFTKLKRYGDAAWQQEASARVDHAYLSIARILPEQIHNYAHNNDWLVENLAYVGRVNDALELARNMIELPRLGPNSKLVGKGAGYDDARSGFTMGRNRLLETALRYELWPQIASWDGTPYLAPAEDPSDEVQRLRALGSAYFSKGDKTRGAAHAALLETAVAKVREARVAAADRAEADAKRDKKKPDEVTRAMAEALQKQAKRVTAATSALAEVRLYGALAAALPGEARAELALATEMPAERRARALFQLGDIGPAEHAAREAVDKSEGQVLPLAIQADLLWRLGKKVEAREAFTKLRALAGQLDLEVGVFARLLPIARDLGLPPDWRPRHEHGADSGTRPALETLGPFRWSPYKAPEWSLSDQTGRQLSLAERKGKPTLILFYLGSGCSHCIEQLNIFGPLTAAFAEAGIQLVAVSTESADALHKTFAKAAGGTGFPFPILADPTLATYKTYRAFDDFENMALHGAYLIDGAGFVRWQDISFEPFRDAKWLLEESKRLLALPVSVAGATAAAAPQ